MPILTRNALLHWRASDLSLTARSGQVGALTRASDGYAANASGILTKHVTNVPRWHWRTDPVSGAPVVGLYLEGEKQNACTYSQAFASWTGTKAGTGSYPVVTSDQTVAPDGQATADKVVFAAPISGDESLINGNSIAGSAVKYCGSVFAKAFAAGDVGKVLVYRHMGASGYGTMTLTAEWQRVERVETGFAGSTSLSIGLRPQIAGSSGTVSCYLWQGQVELGGIASSVIPTTTAAATRSQDVLTFSFLPTPRLMTAYVRSWMPSWFTDGTTNHHHFYIGTAPTLLSARLDGQLARQNAQHYEGASYRSAQVATGAYAAGQVLESRVVLYADGNVLAAQRENGGAERTNVTASALALGAAFGSLSLRMNASDTGAQPNYAVYERVLLVDGEQTMNDLADAA